MKLQEEMEKQYGIRSRSGGVEIPLQGLVGYNADLEIYKIRFMDTEAGVSIPIASARKFTNQWIEAYIRAIKAQIEGEKATSTARLNCIIHRIRNFTL